MPDVTVRLLLFFVMPLWLAAGFADYVCHRAMRIESTSGAKESLLHLAQLVEISIPILAALFFEIDALVFAIMIASLVAHELTAFWDSRYAASAREVPPIEQHVHSFLEVLPLTALLMVASLAWPQFAALFGVGPEPARFELVLRTDPVPVAYIVTILVLVFVFELLPYAEELVRGLVVNHGRLVPDKALNEATRS